MSLILIGFGGTGAKMVQSFVMMGAAGALKVSPPVKILLVDQDKGNGNTVRAVEAIELYRDIREILAHDNDPVRPYNVDFQRYSDIVWQPLPSPEETLGTRFGYSTISSDRNLNSRLLELLYSSAQINATLEKGFLGNPDIGAPVFADTIDFDKQPWKDLDQDIANGLNQGAGGTRIVLCGSIFGGTGAAGIPNTAKVLRHRLDNEHKAPGHDRAKIILNLAMPYFTIREVANAALQAAGKDFLPNCKAALRYYHDQKYLDFCDAIYLLGEADMAPIEVAHLGDRSQKNSAHPLELFAACNNFDALVSNDLNCKLILSQRRKKQEYTWGDLPLKEPVESSAFARARMGAFARMSFAFLCVKQGLVNFNQRESVGDNSWLTDYFTHGKDLDLSRFSKIERFSRMYLEWAGEMQLSAASMSDKHQTYEAKWFGHQQLVEGNARELNVRLKPIDPSGLGKLVLPWNADERFSYHDLHNYLVELKPTQTGFSGLVNGFYHGCIQNLRESDSEAHATPTKSGSQQQPEDSPFLMVSTGKDKTEGGLTTTSGVGHIRSDRDAIKKLGDQIDAPDLGFDASSIPDMWGQLLKLQHTLLTVQKQVKAKMELRPQLRQARTQWRGLMALVVLRKELGIENDFKLLPVFPFDKQTGKLLEPGRFLKKALELLPDGPTNIKVGWKFIHVITFRGITIGCTSPLTFVCPSATTPRAKTGELAIPGCDWFRDGLFTDPIEYLEGSSLGALKKWIGIAKETLASTAKGHEDYIKAIQANDGIALELKSFEEEIERKVARRGGTLNATFEMKNDDKFNMAGTEAEFNTVQQCLQKLVFTSSDITEEQVKQSPFLLREPPGAESPTKILLIGPSFVNLPGFDSGRIEVLRGVSLNRALIEYTGDHKRLKTLNSGPCEIYRVDEVFCDRIFVVRLENALPGAFDYPGGSALLKNEGTAGLAVILPLRSAFVSHFTPDYLCKNVAFSGDENQITVSLNIELNVPGLETGRKVPISHTYKDEDKQIEYGRLPEFRIWPEYNEKDLPGWKRWYTYYNDLNVPGNKLLISPRLDPIPKIVVTSAADVDGWDEKNRTPVPPAVVIDPTDKEKRIVINQRSQFPRVLDCRLDGIEYGILLTKPVKLRVEKHTGDWEIGIDFGTTGTSVYYTQEGSSENPQILSLAPHVLSVTSPGAAESYEFFLPTDKENIDGLLSIFKDFKGDTERNDVPPFLEGHISFIDRSKVLDEDEAVRSEGLCANMKWGDPLDRARATAFLQQLCLLTALQAKLDGARSIRWVFSYPLSFGRKRRDNFSAMWRSCANFALKISGLNPPDHSQKPFRYRDESACASKFAEKRHQARLLSGAIVLDIGGGSSDISIWSKNQPIHNISVKFAGRDVLQRPLLGKPELLSRFVASEGSRKFVESLVRNKALRRNETVFFSKVDALFKIKSQEIFEILPRVNGEREVEGFLGILSMGLRGLFFYTGIILRGLVEQGKFGKKLPDVVVCGNGGRILNWLDDSGHFEKDSWVEGELLKSLLAGSGFTGQTIDGARITLSDQPKAEAAYGMLVDPEGKPADIGDAPPEVIAGEAFRHGQKKYDPLDIVPFQELEMNGSAFEISEELPMITEFLSASGPRTLPSRTREDLIEEINKRLLDIAHRRNNAKVNDPDAEKDDAQPIFIIALNELIKLATRDWAAGEEAWWL